MRRPYQEHLHMELQRGCSSLIQHPRRRWHRTRVPSGRNYHPLCPNVPTDSTAPFRIDVQSGPMSSALLQLPWCCCLWPTWGSPTQRHMAGFPSGAKPHLDTESWHLVYSDSESSAAEQPIDWRLFGRIGELRARARSMRQARRSKRCELFRRCFEASPDPMG